jgi:hypothetical protein
MQYVSIFRTSCGCIRVGSYHPLFFYDTDIGIDSNINYLDIINDWNRTPFGACVISANVYMKIRYDEVKFAAGFYETTNLVYGYMAPVVKA